MEGGAAPKTIVRKGYHRKGYTRKDGTRVAPTDVPATRILAKGMAAKTGQKGKKLFSLDGKHLKKYGYTLKKNVAERRIALNKAIKGEGHLWVIERLNALRILFKNTEPKLDKKLDKDVKYVQLHYKEYKKTHEREHRTHEK